MAQTIKKLIGVFLILCSTTILDGCDPFGSNTEKPTDEDLRLFFEEHKDSLRKVVSLCENNPAIRWVGKEKTSVSFYKAPAPGPSVQESVEKIREILEPLKINSMHCVRSGSTSGNPLVDVMFSVYSRGLAVSGEGKAIRYRFDWAVSKWADDMEKSLQSGQFKPLPDKGWYIYQSQN